MYPLLCSVPKKKKIQRENININAGCVYVYVYDVCVCVCVCVCIPSLPKPLVRLALCFFQCCYTKQIEGEKIQRWAARKASWNIEGVEPGNQEGPD